MVSIILKRIAGLGLLLGVSISLNACVLLVPFIEYDGGDTQGLVPVACSHGCPSPDIVRVSSKGITQVYVPGKTVPAAVKKPLRKTRKPNRKQQKVAQLLEQLQHENAAQRTNAASDLGYLGKDAMIAIPPLNNAIRHDQSKWVRRAAVKAVARISSDNRVIEALRDALNDRNKWVVHSAAGALRRIGTQEAIAALNQHST